MIFILLELSRLREWRIGYHLLLSFGCHFALRLRLAGTHAVRLLRLGGSVVVRMLFVATAHWPLVVILLVVRVPLQVAMLSHVGSGLEVAVAIVRFVCSWLVVAGLLFS
jgi:hypothetical protein